MNAKPLLFLMLSFFCGGFQASGQQKSFTRYDYLHGKLSPMRTCIDVKQYEITLKVEPAKKYISGHNDITFYSKNDFRKLQIDLHWKLRIDSIVYGNMPLQYYRDSSFTFIDFGFTVKKNQLRKLKIYYSGQPLEAKKAPWDGGFVWSKDASGNDWVGLACEGIGASVWLPCKDHWSDEPDSVKMHLIVPHELTGVSNGRLISVQDIGNGFKHFYWKTGNSINTYNISVNIGNYAHIHDTYEARFTPTNKPLMLDYYVLDENKDKAATHFQQVKGMLACYEKYFGAYPFWDDGYKLVETPFWGMEHQSCVAYGNNYENNRYDFDFIIIHESAHEWFGNSITASDPADMWIHESFTTYAEAIYVEYLMGKETALRYLKEQKRNIENREPMIGTYDVHYHGRKDNDIYYKGSWMLHTLRNVVDNDTLWFSALRNFSLRYKKQIINTATVIRYFSEATRMNLKPFFTQYLYKAGLPVLEYELKQTEDGRMEIKYRWSNIVKGFEMPVRATLTKDLFETITPMRAWQLIEPNYILPDDFKIQTDNFLIDLLKR
jgi:aminopeptidase N